MHTRKAYSLPSLLLIVGLCQLGLEACSSNARLGYDNETLDASGGVAGTGGSTNSSPTGGKTATDTTTVAGTGTGGSTARPLLPKACHGIAFDTKSADAGTLINPADGTQCGGVGAEIETAPLDLYIMMDRTYSMTYPVGTAGLTRWDVLLQGVQQFLADPTLIGNKPRLGFRFFGETGNPDDPIECVPETYAAPLIPIEDIATVSPKILSAMDTETQYLGGQTPWLPSLHGALQYAQSWQQANPWRATAVLFVTDGYPTECARDMNDIVEVAGEYFAGVQGIYNTIGKPSIRTFIIGVGGTISQNGYNIDAVAQAGGTGSATVVDDDGAVGQFVQTVVNISKADIQCEYSLVKDSNAGRVNPDLVQVIYNPFYGQPEQFPMARTPADCNSTEGGWYFDDPVNPKTITLCPCTCANLGAGNIDVRLGCYPIRTIG